jgi:hypothetical protein
MFISVGGGNVIPKASGRRQLFELSMMSHVSGVLGYHGVLTLIALVLILIIVGVVFPAIWSGNKARRSAALAVLDRLLRWRR